MTAELPPEEDFRDPPQDMAPDAYGVIALARLAKFMQSHPSPGVEGPHSNPDRATPDLPEAS